MNSQRKRLETVLQLLVFDSGEYLGTRCRETSFCTLVPFLPKLSSLFQSNLGNKTPQAASSFSSSCRPRTFRRRLTLMRKERGCFPGAGAPIAPSKSLAMLIAAQAFWTRNTPAHYRLAHALYESAIMSYCFNGFRGRVLDILCEECARQDESESGKQPSEPGVGSLFLGATAVKSSRNHDSLGDRKTSSPSDRLPKNEHASAMRMHRHQFRINRSSRFPPTPRRAASPLPATPDSQNHAALGIHRAILRGRTPCDTDRISYSH